MSMVFSPIAWQLAAQRGTAISGQVTIESGRGYGGEFYDRGVDWVRVAASIVPRTRGRVDPFVELALSGMPVPTGSYAICFASSRGGCTPSYPQFNGPEVIAGIMGRPSDHLELRAGLGAGAYDGDHVRVGGIAGVVDAAVFPYEHLALVVGARVVVIPRYRGDHLTNRLFALGIRIR